jgi:hypothetical protein
MKGGFSEAASVADQIHLRDRAAPLARRLAAGVGGGVALARSAVG